MENNSQPPAPAAPAKVTPPANEPPKTTHASSNHEVVPMAAARTAATNGSAAQSQPGTVFGSVPFRSVQQHPQPSSRSLLQVQRQLVQGSCSNKAVFATAGTGTGAMYSTTAQCGAPMPRSPTAVSSLAVFGQGSSFSNQAMQLSSSNQAVEATPLVATMHVPTAQYGAAVRPLLPPAPRVVRRRRKLKITRPPSPPPPRPELASSSAAGNALLQSSWDTGFRVRNMQAYPRPPSPDQVKMTDEASDSEGGGSSGDDVEMLDLNFPPVSKNKDN